MIDFLKEKRGDLNGEFFCFKCVFVLLEILDVKRIVAEYRFWRYEFNFVLFKKFGIYLLDEINEKGGVFSF